MNKLVEFIKQYKWILIAFVSGPVFVNILVLIPAIPRVTAGNTELWLSFFGNYSGGIIGGIVALLVTKYQIDQQKKVDHNKRLLEQLPTLHAIKIELDKIRSVMENYSSGFNQFTELHEEMVKGKHLVSDWNQQLFSNVDLIVDETLLVDLLYFREEYLEIWGSLRYDLIGLISELETSKKVNTAARMFDKRILQKEAELAVLITQIEAEKRSAWEAISSGVIVTKIDALLKKLKKEIRAASNGDT
ncbi:MULTISPECIES: hypothetical protein [unclassified Paenibacillus]|uniref:hypothetical protein n=1 Tax=unclassified Paenibacillus TaxID=185978 RepID=UPI0003F99099|nr:MULTISPECIES: hypothetical protein [unclassified Paenibacillus]